MLKPLRSCFLLWMCFHVANAAPTSHTASFCFEEWYPYSYTTPNGSAAGSSVKRIQTALKAIKVDATFEELPFARCVKLTKEGKVDFAMHVDESDGLTTLQPATNYWQLTFAVRKGTYQSLEQLMDQKNVHLALGQDYSYPDTLLATIKRMPWTVSYTSFYTSTEDDTRKLFRLLETGHVDAILIDKVWALERTQAYEIPVVILDDVFHSEPQFIGFNSQTATKHKQVIDQISQFLSDIKKAQ